MSTGEYADPAAGEKNPLRSEGVLEHKGGASETPAPTSSEPIVAIRERLARIVNYQLERMENGEIDQLSDQHNSMLQQLLQSPRRQQRQQGRQQQGIRQQPRQRGTQRTNNQRKPRPHCTYDKCDKPVGHWESTCLQKARDIKSRHFSKRDRSNSPRGNSRRFRRHHRDDDDDDDDVEDDRRSQASSTRGEDN
eukprot:jgi/Undpi1/12507/HiC_scaffold_6.g02176.m1